MTRRVFKYEVSVHEQPTILPMPLGATIVAVSDSPDPGVVWMWADVRDEMPTEDREFIITGTGHAVPTTGVFIEPTYIGTAVVKSHGVVWHVFEVGSL